MLLNDNNNLIKKVTFSMVLKTPIWLVHLAARAQPMSIPNFLPHLSYCILVWGSEIKNNHPLLLLQKKAVRNIANEDYIAFAHSEPLCKSLNILKMIQIFKYRCYVGF